MFFLSNLELLKKSMELTIDLSGILIVIYVHVFSCKSESRLYFRAWCVVFCCYMIRFIIQANRTGSTTPAAPLAAVWLQRTTLCQNHYLGCPQSFHACLVVPVPVGMYSHLEVVRIHSQAPGQLFYQDSETIMMVFDWPMKTLRDLIICALLEKKAKR